MGSMFLAISQSHLHNYGSFTYSKCGLNGKCTLNLGVAAAQLQSLKDTGHLLTRNCCIESLIAEMRPVISTVSRSRVRKRFKWLRMIIRCACSPTDFHDLPFETEINKTLYRGMVTH